VRPLTNESGRVHDAVVWNRLTGSLACVIRPRGNASRGEVPCDTLEQRTREASALVQDVWRGVGPGPASEWEGSVFDDAFHDQGGAEALHAGEGGEAVVVELLEGGQVGGDDA
jgi:hypothetical protein